MATESRRRTRRLLAVVGTRPEAVKLAPVVLAARELGGVDVRLLGSGQHPREMLEVLEYFGLGLDGQLARELEPHDLAGSAAGILPGLSAAFLADRPDAVVVQGDTTTAFVAALAAYYLRIPVAHVEAGLRTYHRYEPFPEELNRRLIDLIASYLFPPTDVASRQLAAEGLRGDHVFTTGNTIVDALRLLVARGGAVLDGHARGFTDPCHRKRVLVTAHRRESWGEPLDEVAAALAHLGARLPDHVFLLPAHPNPVVRRSFLQRPLPANVLVVEPLPYAQFVAALECADLVVTDSGGVVEEATALGRPLLILRDRTERPEALTAGARLVGVRSDAIEAAVVETLAVGAAAAPADVFGDGRAGERIVGWLRWRLGLEATQPEPFVGAAGYDAEAATRPNLTVASSS